ncbi:MAG: SDR family oxidoreductase [Gaiellales bacterium]|nr:SDR family oxidoreductase [Gaiellales bacterium]
MGLEGKVALVTGGAFGIGKAIATRLLQDGAAVAILDIDLAKAQETVSELEQGGGKVMAVQCDVTSVQSAKDAVAAVARTMGSPDILVNNAGVDKQQLFVETDEKLWDWMISINYKGFLVATHATIPYMIEKKSGIIVNLGSDAGRIGNAREVVYSGTKAAVMASTKALAQELARFNIRVNAVSPGPIQATALLSGLFEGEIGERIAKVVPMKRLGQPEEVAAVVSFFCSEDSRYLTGQVLSIDGGLTMIG